MSEPFSSQDNEYLFAAVSYFPVFAPFLIFYAGKKHLHFLRYHSAHSFLIYFFSLLILLLYIIFFVLLNKLFNDSFLLNIIWGLIFSLHLLFNFIYIFYCSVKALTGNYLVIPLVTRAYYAIFHR